MIESREQTAAKLKILDTFRLPVFDFYFMQIKIFNSRQLNATQEFNLYLATNNLKKECFIGRSPSSTLVLDSADVSRLHGKFIQQNGDYYFIDIGSRNGSIINGKLAEINYKYLLKPGDIVRIGEFVLILEEMDVIRQDLAETVFGNTNAMTSDRHNQQEQSPINEIQLDESGNEFAEATFIQLPILDSPIETATFMAQSPVEETLTYVDIFSEATEIPIGDRPIHTEVVEQITDTGISIGDRPTHIELDEINPILELDPWQDIEPKIESTLPLKEKAIATDTAPIVVSGKYIALMAHDRQKVELAQFVERHQEFLSQHLTIATPITSATLQQAGMEVSAETPALPIGGYQAIANLVNSGNILTVILLEDVLQLPESERESQEALMRACHLNQVLLATNLATAEAIVNYISNRHQ